jgi:hypothetical protein
MLLQGEMAEWSNAVVSKAIIPVKGIGGSNPPLSSSLRSYGATAGQASIFWKWDKDLKLTQ